MAGGVRQRLVAQAALVWSDRGPPALQWYVEWGQLPDTGRDVEPYDQNVVKQLVESGKLI